MDVGAVAGGESARRLAAVGATRRFAGCGAVHEFAGGVCLLFGQGDDLASAQQAAELDLGGGAADRAMTGAGTTGMMPASSLIR